MQERPFHNQKPLGTGPTQLPNLLADTGFGYGRSGSSKEVEK